MSKLLTQSVLSVCACPLCVWVAVGVMPVWWVCLRVTQSADLKRVAATIRVAVSQEHGITPAIIRLMKPHTVPKTTSGKIARQWGRRHYEAGTLPAPLYELQSSMPSPVDEAELLAERRSRKAVMEGGKAAEDGGGDDDAPRYAQPGTMA